MFGDLHCNWRGLGRTCRFCFQDSFGARLADEKAKANGSRVILCATHEPPVPPHRDVSLTFEDLAISDVGMDPTSSAEVPLVDEVADPTAIVYSGNTTRGQMCAFMPGYFEFLPELRASVASILHFMPGMRIGIATAPPDFHAFNR